MTLADKIVLLRPDTAARGLPSIAQVGRPLDLYHHPRNLFVAGFIGSPAMNFLHGQALSCHGGQLRASLPEGLLLDAQVGPASVPPGEQLTLGVRPEHVVLGRGPLRGTVSHLEHLGETTQVYLQVPGQAAMLLAKGAGEQLRLGDSLAFELPPQQVHVFRADGQALPRPASSAAEALAAHA
jgi:multiple sugar transport system ATP-binding protein